MPVSCTLMASPSSATLMMWWVWHAHDVGVAFSRCGGCGMLTIWVACSRFGGCGMLTIWAQCLNLIPMYLHTALTLVHYRCQGTRRPQQLLPQGQEHIIVLAHLSTWNDGMTNSIYRLQMSWKWFSPGFSVATDCIQQIAVVCHITPNIFL